MRKDATHVLENLLDCDPGYEEDLSFIQLFQKLASIDGIDVIITLSCDNIRTLDSNLSSKTKSFSSCSITIIKKLQRLLKHLQDKGIYEI